MYDILFTTTHFLHRQAKLSSYFVSRGTCDDTKREGKRKFEGGDSAVDKVPTKKAKAEKKKITSFFALKSNKNLGDKNDNQELKNQKEDLDPESRLAPTSSSQMCKVNPSPVTSNSGGEKSVRSSKDNSGAVTAWSSMFNKAAVVAPVCAGHSEPCVKRKVRKP